MSVFASHPAEGLGFTLGWDVNFLRGNVFSGVISFSVHLKIILTKDFLYLFRIEGKHLIDAFFSIAIICKKNKIYFLFHVENITKSQKFNFMEKRNGQKYGGLINDF